MPLHSKALLSTRRQFYFIIALTLVGVFLFTLFASSEGPMFIINPLRLPSNFDPYIGDSTNSSAYSLQNEDTLSKEDFKQDLQYHSQLQSNHFSSQDAWRPSDIYEIPFDHLIHDTPLHRPKIMPPNTYRNKAEYLRQPIVADYAPNSEKIFLMMKEGATVLWHRLPIHLITTFSKVPYFSIYADTPASIGGYEVIDILQNVTQASFETDDFELYRKLAKLRRFSAGIDPSELNLKGGWALDKYKNIPMLVHALEVAPASVEWFVFMDGDTYFFLDNLMDWLSTLDSSDPLYLGSTASFGSMQFAHGGSGVAISRAALEKSIGQHPEWVEELEADARRICCGDVLVSTLLEKINVSVSRGYDYPHVGWKFQGQPQWNLGANSETWCQKVVSFHHLSPYDVETLWEYERLLGPERRQHITYGDIYRDFVAPHIDQWMDEWNNMASQWRFTEEEDIKKQKERDAKEKERKEKEASRTEDVRKAKETGDHKSQTQDTKKKTQHKPKETGHRSGDKKEEYKHERRNNDRPWKSAKLCQAACQEDKNCLSWRYLPFQKYCGLDTRLKLGRPAIPDIDISYFEHDKNINHTGVVSGFVIDRIRKMRREKKCDLLYKDFEQKNDEEYLQKIHKGQVVDRYEGWYRRMQDQETEQLKEEYS